jgi:hypothetical protein
VPFRKLTRHTMSVETTWDWGVQRLEVGTDTAYFWAKNSIAR